MLYNHPILNEYDVLVFDMDGVLLNSLDRLSKALTDCVKSDMDESTFAKFLEYDRLNPGKSRFEKFQYAYETILESQNHEKQIKTALSDFAKKSLDARIDSKLEIAIFELFQKFNSKAFVLLSNCSNDQIQKVVSHHKMDSVFQGQIYGTPPTKLDTLKTIAQANPGKKLISISDSSSDAEIADELEIDFLYVHRFARGNTKWIREQYFTASSLSEFLD
jgi:phosphoglycolate phosphatase-like HAD superfamily hydrolase